MRPVSQFAIILLAALPCTAGAGDPPLTIHQAAEKGDVARLKALLAENPKLIAAVDDMQQTPLHIAVHRGKIEAVELLLKSGAPVNERAYNQFTPLHLARDPRIIKLLVANKADLEASSVFGETALEDAALHAGSHPKGPDNIWWTIVTTLRDLGAKYTLCAATRLGDAARVKELLADKKLPKDSASKMREAASGGHVEVVRLMLALKADSTEADYFGMPLLYFALEHPAVVKVLLDAGANPNSPLKYEGSGQGWPEGDTLLHEAASKGQLESVRLLLDRGAILDAKVSNGATPVQWAAYDGHLDVVKYFVEKGADVKGERGVAAMKAAARPIRVPADGKEKAVQERRIAVIKYLGTLGVPMDLLTAIAVDNRDRAKELIRDQPKLAAEVGSDGRPLAHRAVALNRFEILKLMLDAGVSVDAADKDGGTILHSAAFWGHEKIVELLIRRKAMIDARDKNGATPLHEAARLASFAAVKLLIAAGADTNAKDDKGHTPLWWAEWSVEHDIGSDRKPEKANVQVRDLLRELAAKK